MVRAAAGLGPVDVLANLAGFGDTARIRHLGPFLDACLHPGARLLLDIRKGSGGFPFLSGRGECTTLATRDDAGTEVKRVRFAPAPPPAAGPGPAAAAAPAPATGDWAALAAALPARAAFSPTMAGTPSSSCRAATPWW